MCVVEINAKSSEMFIGRDAGRRLMQEITNAEKSIKIVSPYLSAKYVKELISLKKEKGLHISLVTTDEIKEDNHCEFYHTDLIEQEQITDYKRKKTRKKGIIWNLIAMFIIAFIGVEIPEAWLGLVVPLVLLLFFYQMSIYEYKYHPQFRIKIINSEYNRQQKGDYLVHSKLYVIDNKVAYVGSVNFTYKGMVHNYENITRITDAKAVMKISKEIEEIFNDRTLITKNIVQWGKMLYPEPKHPRLF